MASVWLASVTVVSLVLSDALTSARTELQRRAAAEPTDDERALLRRYETSLAPLERALWSPPQADDAPLDATVRSFSRELDELEVTVTGPFLVGKAFGAADAILFPSLCAYNLVLPAHYGWQEWTDEALFWKRPRLHAWFELMGRELGAASACAIVAEAVSQQSFEWAVETPTNGCRTIPAHAL